MSGIVLNGAGATNRGRIRKVNEDDFLVDGQLSLFAVADGLGGHGSGNVASSLAIETLQEEVHAGLQVFTADNPSDADQLCSAINIAVSSVNKTIYDKNKERGFSDGAGMGTTLVGTVFFNGNTEFVSFNIGDSRLYRSTSNELVQLTKDHSLIQEGHDMGQPGEAPAAKLLKRAVGLFPTVEADLVIHSFKAGGLLMLCSDGLTAMVADNAISDSINSLSASQPDEICINLVDNANKNGGEDNITVVVIKPD